MSPDKSKSTSGVNHNNLAKDIALKRFRSVRPNLIKLFTHVVLFYLSMRGYLDFLSSEESYEDFLINLGLPIVIDAKMINSSLSCSDSYQEVSTTYFPSTEEGCRCDYGIFQKNACNYISSQLNNSDEWAAICKRQNDLLRNFTQNRLLEDVQDIEDTKTKTAFTYLTSPNHCGCYQAIPAIGDNKTIDTWFLDKKICILKDNSTSTQRYLEYALVWNCSIANTCQNYFCKENFDSKKCKIYLLR